MEDRHRVMVGKEHKHLDGVRENGKIVAEEISKDHITSGFIWLVNNLGNQDLGSCDQYKCSNGDKDQRSENRAFMINPDYVQVVAREAL